MSRGTNTSIQSNHEESNDGMARNVSNNVESLEIHIYHYTNENVYKEKICRKSYGQMVLRVDEHDIVIE